MGYVRAKSLLYIFLLAFLVFYGPLLKAAEKTTKSKEGPSLVVAQPTFEAGKVLEGEEIVHTFIIQNKGTKDLVIKSVKPG
ncbi:MAG: hypothetical protein JRJ48_01780 [Deltaproteobacteria bacterium]|nr:hypothetical protein [Deltaproteobacteria bacterium]